MPTESGNRKGETMNATPFILAFRPHRRPAWADSFESEAELIDAWQSGQYDRECFANNNLSDEERAPTIENALAAVGHDLHALTRLNSAEECRRYLGERNYAGHHNKGYAEVSEAARELGWLEDHDNEGIFY
jgi:hypothetical protein